MLRPSLLVIGGLCVATVSADSITVGEQRYDDVYVRSDDNFYYIHLPEEGRVEKVSRQRQDVGEPSISPDESKREQLLAQFEIVKAQNAPDPAEMKEVAEKESAEPAVDVNAEPVDITTEQIKELEAQRQQALFNAQYEYWTRLTEAEKSQVRSNLLAYAEGTAGSYAIEQGEVLNDIAALEAQKQLHQAWTGELEAYKRRVEAEAMQGDVSARFAAAYHQWLTQNQVGHQLAARSLEESIDDKEQVAVALENKRGERANRTGAFLTRIEALIQAENEDFEPALEPTVVQSWSGSDSQKTEAFTIEEPFWRLTIARDDFGNSGALSVVVYDAETDQPFTRISDVDFLQMRVRILDGRGSFYLEIEQDSTGTPYEITVETFEN